MDLWTSLNGASFEALSKTCTEVGVCMEALAMAAKSVASAFSPAWGGIKDSMRDLLEPMETILSSAQDSFYQWSTLPRSSLVEALLEDSWDYIPPRVRHLALHHPKARVRNKNWSRIWKIRKEYMQCKR